MMEKDFTYGWKELTSFRLVGCILQRINSYKLFIAKSCLYRYIKDI